MADPQSKNTETWKHSKYKIIISIYLSTHIATFRYALIFQFIFQVKVKVWLTPLSGKKKT